MAFHWYDHFMNGVGYHERLNNTYNVDKNCFMLITKRCNCPSDSYGAGTWLLAQRYGQDILTDLNRWSCRRSRSGKPRYT